VVLLRELPDVDVAPAETESSVDGVLLILERGARQVEVEPVLSGLLACRDNESQANLSFVTGQQGAIGLGHDLTAEQTGPKRCRSVRVVGIERHCDQSRGHARRLETTPNAKPMISLLHDVVALDAA